LDIRNQSNQVTEKEGLNSLLNRSVRSNKL
jgi:hypothetical protein